MQSTSSAGASLSPGLQTLNTEGLRIYGLGRPTRNTGASLLAAESPEQHINALIARHTVSGYTSHAALCKALEAALRDLHAEARKQLRSMATLELRL